MTDIIDKNYNSVADTSIDKNDNAVADTTIDKNDNERPDATIEKNEIDETAVEKIVEVSKRPQLIGMTKQEIANLLPNYPKFTATQIFGFLHEGKNFENMTSLKKELRAWLSCNCITNPVKICKVFKGKCGTKKYLFELPDGEFVEGVYMLHDYGNTLCLSTQIGCRMGCTFCASGMDGIVRNLTAGEMLGQVIAVNADNGGDVQDRVVTNVVLMGSGEPFDNYQNVLKFLDLVNAGEGINISERNISLSTSGVADKLDNFAESGHKVTVSISLHAPFDAMRSEIMPINKKYNIATIMKSARNYFDKTGRRMIFEYTLIAGKNDTEECAKELARLTRGFPAHINIIRLNAVKELNIRPSSEDATGAFLKMLENLKVSATIRRSLGSDVEGACGQLRRKFVNREL